MQTRFLLLLALSLSGRVCFGQAAATPAPAACTAAEFRQFDFWLGKWNVRKPDGSKSGSSEITRVAEGCAVREDWTGGDGKHGMSINYYDPATKRWEQDWVGGDGSILHLRGGMENGAMVLSDAPNDSSAANRITWTPLSPNSVKQEWALSKDGGKSCQILFVGIYDRL